MRSKPARVLYSTLVLSLAAACGSKTPTPAAPETLPVAPQPSASAPKAAATPVASSAHAPAATAVAPQPSATVPAAATSANAAPPVMPTPSSVVLSGLTEIRARAATPVSSFAVDATWLYFTLQGEQALVRCQHANCLATAERIELPYLTSPVQVVYGNQTFYAFGAMKDGANATVSFTGNGRPTAVDNGIRARAGDVLALGGTRNSVVRATRPATGALIDFSRYTAQDSDLAERRSPLPAKINVGSLLTGTAAVFMTEKSVDDDVSAKGGVLVMRDNNDRFMPYAPATVFEDFPHDMVEFDDRLLFAMHPGAPGNIKVKYCESSATCARPALLRFGGMLPTASGVDGSYRFAATKTDLYFWSLADGANGSLYACAAAELARGTCTGVKVAATGFSSPTTHHSDGKNLFYLNESGVLYRVDH
jgi:hypothetical protein